jgi:hypothetical protein
MVATLTIYLKNFVAAIMTCLNITEYNVTDDHRYVSFIVVKIPPLSPFITYHLSSPPMLSKFRAAQSLVFFAVHFGPLFVVTFSPLLIVLSVFSTEYPFSCIFRVPYDEHQLINNRQMTKRNQ